VHPQGGALRIERRDRQPHFDGFVAGWSRTPGNAGVPDSCE
jgi:hypothetical protein